MSPTRLVDSVVLSSGAMTNRIDRVEAPGLVERLPDPDDRRGTLVGARHCSNSGRWRRDGTPAAR
ncbi:MAG: MarR family transcriptional regulator [Candidatus Dormibacteria bacterium]